MSRGGLETRSGRLPTSGRNSIITVPTPCDEGHGLPISFSHAGPGNHSQKLPLAGKPIRVWQPRNRTSMPHAHWQFLRLFSQASSKPSKFEANGAPVGHGLADRNVGAGARTVVRLDRDIGEIVAPGSDVVMIGRIRPGDRSID